MPSVSSYCVDISDKTQLRLVNADITDLCVDAIVSTIDEHGTPNTELAQHIVAKGGPAVKDKLQKKVTSKLKNGAVVKSDGGQLPYKKVIHVQYPPAHLTTTLNDRLSSDEYEAIKCCIVNILETCKKPKYKFNSLAIPVIGSYSNNSKKMAHCMWSMAVALCECVEVIKSLSLRYIVLVAYGTDNFTLFHEKLQLEFNNRPNTKFTVVPIDKCVRVSDCRVSLMTGDLLMMKVGAIVVAIARNKDLTRGQLAPSIHQKDPNIQRQLQDSKWSDEGTGSGVIVCQSNILASRYVFFIHLLDHTDPNVDQHFSDAIDVCLKMAAKKDIKSIAFPVLGTGILLNYPDDFVASCMIAVIEKFCQGQPGKCTDIRIVRYRDTEATAFVGEFESLAKTAGNNCWPDKNADSQAGGSNQTSVAGAAAGGSQSNVTSSNVASVVGARASMLQVDRPKSGYHGSAHHRQNVTADETYSRDRSPVSDRVWVYEDTDEQWTEFTPGLQATLENDHSSGYDNSTWPCSEYDRRIHTVNFKTQPMTYMVKCGGTVLLSTAVERRVKI